MRLIEATEIKVRPNEVKGFENKVTVSLLLYKDSRYDMAVLDEEFGIYGWETRYQVIDGVLYCTIRVWDSEHNHWVEKTSNGVESNMEKEKGEASDALKRAGFLLGIGRELYTTPNISIELNPNEYFGTGQKDNFGNERYRIKPWIKFYVSEIAYNKEARQIIKLSIVDNNGNLRFKWDIDNGKQSIKSNKAITSQPQKKNQAPVEPTPTPTTTSMKETNNATGQFADGFTPIAVFNPIEAWKHLISKVGLEDAKAIVGELGLHTQDDIKGMNEFVYHNALKKAEKRFYDSVITNEVK